MLRHQSKLVTKLEARSEWAHSAAVHLAKSSLVAAYNSQNMPLPQFLRAPTLSSNDQSGRVSSKKVNHEPKRLASVIVKKKKSSSTKRSLPIDRYEEENDIRHVMLTTPSLTQACSMETDMEILDVHAPSDIE